jgi:hypothetical protein
MEKSELRAVIKFFFLKKLSTKDTHAEIVNILGDNAVSYSLVKKWVARFKSGNESTKDGARQEDQHRQLTRIMSNKSNPWF